MLRKSLLMAACLCLLAAPMAMAANNGASGTAYSAGQASAEGAPGYGVCYSGRDGEGEAINWVKNPEQCQYSSNGQSWVVDGIVRQNFQRGN